MKKNSKTIKPKKSAPQRRSKLPQAKSKHDSVLKENAELRLRLSEAEETLEAIRKGDVDALVVSGPGGEQVYALKGAEQPYRILVESMNEGALSLTETGVIMNYNKAFEKMAGSSSGSLVGKSFQDLVSENDATAFAKFWERAVDNEARTEIELHINERTLPTFMSAGARLIDGDCWVFAVVTDITERKRTEKELNKYRKDLEKLVDTRTNQLRSANEELQKIIQDLESSNKKLKKAYENVAVNEAKFEAMFSSTSDGVLIKNLTGQLLEVNDAYCRMSGYSREELLHMHIEHLRVETAPEISRQMQEVIKQGSQRYESQHRRKDGSIFESEVVALYLDIEGGKIASFIRDVTNRKRAEQALKQSNLELEATNKELEAFIYSVSHDLRAPLRTMAGFSKILIEDYAEKLDDAGRDYLTRINRGAEKMTRLIDDLLRLSSLSRQEIERTDIDLGKLAGSVVHMLCETYAGRTVDVAIADGVTASVDANLIRLVLANLLDNAWKFTGKKEHAEVEFGSFDKEGRQVYFVRDNGAGFEVKYAERMFSPFQRLHSEAEFTGTGIGLAIVERIIHRHGGKVWAEGEVGKGATFYFTLEN